jgi:hypothetical protein
MALYNLPAIMKAVLQPDKHSHKLTTSEQPVPMPTHPEDVLVKVYTTATIKGSLNGLFGSLALYLKIRSLSQDRISQGLLSSLPQIAALRLLIKSTLMLMSPSLALQLSI